MSNSTTSSKEYWKKSSFNLNLILPIYAVVLLVCIIGNTLICVTIYRNKKMRSRWYFFLVSLSIADLGFAITTPIQALQYVNVKLGDVGCKSGIFVLDIFVGASLLSLAVISLDRYFGICTEHLQQMDERLIKAPWIIALIWLASSVVYLPMVFACEMSKLPDSLACDCHSRWPKPIYYTLYSFIVTLAIYVFPFTTIFFCYYKICRKLWGDSDDMICSDPTGTKRRSIKMLVVTAVVFFIAWTPFNCLYVSKKLDLINPKLLGKLFLFAEVLGFAISATNPFIYCIFSKNFRQGFKSIYCTGRKENQTRTSLNTIRRAEEILTEGKRNAEASDTGYGEELGKTTSE